VPGTVSPELQRRIGAPYPDGWDTIPGTPAAWRDLAARSAAAVAPHLSVVRQRLRIQGEPTRSAGVGVFVLTPGDLSPANHDRLLVHVHGGGYVLYPGEAGAGAGRVC
jgi:acetyl esterase/lipase